MSRAPAFSSFYGEGAGRLLTIYHDVTQACCNRSTHDPHVTHSTRVRGKRNWRGSYCGKTLPRIPAHRSGPSPITLRAYMWPRPGCSCRCRKVGVPFCTPLLVRGQPQPHAPGHAWRDGGSEDTRLPEQHQAIGVRSDGTRWALPGKSLVGAAYVAPARALPGQLAQHQRSRHH